ncbi:MAG: hypothetical protein HQL51_10740 [Magnetococcales bacterium]|nr:hypothetical protein [Magnetococcales bacterium]
MKRLLPAPLLAAALLAAALAPPGEAASLYRNACERPQEGVTLCWELTADEDAANSPFPEVHLLPIARRNGIGQAERLPDLTSALYRQFLPGDFARRLILEKQPALQLEDAVQLATRGGWPLALWISPRVTRESGPATSGMVDWEIYLISGDDGRLVRTMRVRVEGHPKIKRDNLTPGLVGVGAVQTLNTVAKASFISPLLGAEMVAATVLANQDQTSPPEAGAPLTTLTELAVRQVMTVSQFPLGELGAPPPNKKANPEKKKYVSPYLEMKSDQEG